jgi:hypothetical protein
MGALLVFIALLSFALISHTQKVKPPCEEHNSVEISFKDIIILKNGSLHDTKENLIYPKGTYWKELLFYRGCICKIKPCIRKCCQRNEIRNREGICTSENLTQSEVDSFFQPIVFDLRTLEPNTDLNNVNNRFGVLYTQICMNNRYRLEPDENNYDDRFFLLPNGSLHVPALKANLDHNAFCMDYFEDPGAVFPLLCFEQESIATKVMYTSYPVGMIISTIFMIITLIVYALLPELRNLHGKLLMCHVSSLLVAYIALALVQLGSSVIADWLCVTTGKSTSILI